ncbi:MAG: GTPase [Candidatus Aenigmarchaeota archaeon]|nr:GTPase [Candidatus Aenigmarchaeota archaeon]
MKRETILIVGAAGRDFFNFQRFFKDKQEFDVRAFTAAQIPDIENRRFPKELAGRLYPNGIPIYPEEKMAQVIKELGIKNAVLSYSDLSHQAVMEKASKVMAAGANFWLLAPDSTYLSTRKPVISVCAVRTGCGKSQTTRFIARHFIDRGYKTVAIRHPMPYGDLVKQRCQRFATLEDMDRNECTIEEREEYEHLIRNGIIVYAGVDYEMILKRAEKEADLIIWDGGNNDTSFIKPNLQIVVADPLRLGHELTYYPGHVNLLTANVVLINKANSATRKAIDTLKKTIHTYNPGAAIVVGYSVLKPSSTESLRRKRVLVIEDGPTTTHGGMSTGAATAYVTKQQARIVNPESYAVGSIKEMYNKYPHLKKLLPAMGYSKTQIRELEETIKRTPCDVVVSGTPIDLTSLLSINKKLIHIKYELDDVQHGLTTALQQFESAYLKK